MRVHAHKVSPLLGRPGDALCWDLGQATSAQAQWAPFQPYGEALETHIPHVIARLNREQVTSRSGNVRERPARKRRHKRVAEARWGNAEDARDDTPARTVAARAEAEAETDAEDTPDSSVESA